MTKPLLTDQELDQFDQAANEGLTLSTNAYYQIKLASALSDLRYYKKQSEEKGKLLDQASRIIDSGMGTGILRYDPVQWFMDYHTHQNGGTK